MSEEDTLSYEEPSSEDGTIPIWDPDCSTEEFDASFSLEEEEEPLKKSPLKRDNASINYLLLSPPSLGLRSYYEKRVLTIGRELFSNPNMVENYKLFLDNRAAWCVVAMKWPPSIQSEVLDIFRLMENRVSFLGVDCTK